MKRFCRILSTLLALAVFALCGATGLGESDTSELPSLEDYFSKRDLSGEWSESALPIVLQGDSATASERAVSVEGGTVTILTGGVYVLTGSLDDGQIVVQARGDEKVQLVLNGASVTSSRSAAILVNQADKVFVTLAEGTVNTLSSLAFEDEEVSAVITSCDDLTFNGAGTLVIDSPAGSGIDGKDDVKFASGTYVITAAGRGVDANDHLLIVHGDFTVTTEGTAFRANHEEEDLGGVIVWDGDFQITTGGGAGSAASVEEGARPGGPGGGMGFGLQSAADGGPVTTGEGEQFAPPELGDGDGSMPTPPELGDGDGSMPAPPQFTGGDGAMSIPPEFADGDMPTPQDLEGAEGGMTATLESANGSASAEFPEDRPEWGDMMRGMGDFPGAKAEGRGDEADEDGVVSAKGFKASGDITVLGGSFSLDTADDAFHADGKLSILGGAFDIKSGDDGLHADGELTIAGGTVDIAQSREGLEAEVIAISGGEVSVVSSDDGLNASSSAGEKETFAAQEGVRIDISGGSVRVIAGGDGLDSNGDITVSGGTVVVSGPENDMNGALDCNGTATVTGGAVIAAGASGMAENFSEASTQSAFLVCLSGGAGTLTVSDAAGNEILSASLDKAFQTVVVSSPALAVGERYTVTCGDSSAEITLTGTVTGSDAGGMGGPWNRGGMGFGPVAAPSEATENE